jgi:periplasmic mercuric ion binding protein
MFSTKSLRAAEHNKIIDMKSLRTGSLILSLCLSVFFSFAQDLKTETIPVSGNCGMCKSTIEKAAKKAGVAEANWDEEKKMLTVKYNGTATTSAKIQQSVADAGYDTRDVRATDASYKKLHGCCQYDREEKSKGDKAPKEAKTETLADCCKDASAACCKDKAASCCDDKQEASVKTKPASCTSDKH